VWPDRVKSCRGYRSAGSALRDGSPWPGTGQAWQRDSCRGWTPGRASRTGWGPGHRMAPARAAALMRLAVAGWRIDVAKCRALGWLVRICGPEMFWPAWPVDARDDLKRRELRCVSAGRARARANLARVCTYGSLVRVRLRWLLSVPVSPGLVCLKPRARLHVKGR
jgi:hypothetical protein